MDRRSTDRRFPRRAPSSRPSALGQHLATLVIGRFIVLAVVVVILKLILGELAEGIPAHIARFLSHEACGLARTVTRL
jgi:hypothetical protein